MGVDVSEAVRLAAPSIPSQGEHVPLAVKTRGEWGIEVRLERRNLLAAGGLPGLPVQLVPARGRFAGARPDSGGGLGRRAWRPAGGEARARRRSVALPVWAGAYFEARPVWEAQRGS